MKVRFLLYILCHILLSSIFLYAYVRTCILGDICKCEFILAGHLDAYACVCIGACMSPLQNENILGSQIIFYRYISLYYYNLDFFFDPKHDLSQIPVMNSWDNLVIPVAFSIV